MAHHVAAPMQAATQLQHITSNYTHGMTQRLAVSIHIRVIQAPLVALNHGMSWFSHCFHILFYLLLFSVERRGDLSDSILQRIRGVWYLVTRCAWTRAIVGDRVVGILSPIRDLRVK